jgi:hypothetical protein
MALFSECMEKCGKKVLDTAGVVREAISQHRSTPVRSLFAGFKYCLCTGVDGFESRAGGAALGITDEKKVGQAPDDTPRTASIFPLARFQLTLFADHSSSAPSDPQPGANTKPIPRTAVSA